MVSLLTAAKQGGGGGLLFGVMGAGSLQGFSCAAAASIRLVDVGLFSITLG